MTSPSEAVDTIEKALEGVTPGPWEAKENAYGAVFIYGGETLTTSVGTEYKELVAGGNSHDTLKMKNVAYIAACSPDRMREVLALARKAEAMEREMAEKDARIAALEAGSWEPISTCPIREPVDLWCVYGGEEFAQFEGGASIGKIVPNRFKTEEYGFFGNQSNDGVPQGHARDLIPVAWRKAVPQCPSKIIAKALGIPRTLDDARALIGGDNAQG